MPYKYRRPTGIGALAIRFAAILAIATTARSSQALTPVISPDSGLPGGYVRYRSPGQCSAAARRMADFHWRDRRPDTLAYDPSRATLSASGIDSVRLCAARFDVATLPAAQLDGMLAAALWAQEPALVARVMTRLRAPHPELTPEARALLLKRAGMAFLDARQANLDSAIALRDLMRPLEPAGGMEELQLANEITEAAMRLDRRDVATAAAQYAAALVPSTRTLLDDRTDDYAFALEDAQLHLIQLASRQRGITRTAIQAMFDSSAMALRHASGAPDDIAGRMLTLRTMYDVFGQPTVPVHATYLYGDTTAPSLPRPGVVTLVYTGNTGAEEGMMATNAVLRRLHAEFAAQPFAEVYLTATNGYFFNQLLPRPSEEAELTRKYYLEYQALPATLAIERSYISTSSTGLRKAETPSNRAAYPFWSNRINCEIVGKDGTVKFLGWLTPSTERAFAGAIRDALAEPAR